MNGKNRSCGDPMHSSVFLSKLRSDDVGKEKGKGDRMSSIDPIWFHDFSRSACGGMRFRNFGNGQNSENVVGVAENNRSRLDRFKTVSIQRIRRSIHFSSPYRWSNALARNKSVQTMTDDANTTPPGEHVESTPTSSFRNASSTGEIPSFDGNAQAQATDFANYFCSYAQLYHQKQMLADHNRMAAYHSAILGNAHLFQDKVVMDVGTGSGILAVWAAQAGARKVYAIEYTDMAKHAEQVMKANNVSHIVTVIQSVVETVELPMEQDELQVVPDDDDETGESSQRCVDIIISEWMGYFLLRESMMDSLLRARDRFLKPKTGILMPSHVRMYIAPIVDEDERKAAHRDYAGAMADWNEFCTTTQTVYGVTMDVLQNDFDKEQQDYYLYSSRWTELPPEAVLAEPKCIQDYNLATCTLQDARGIEASDPQATFSFDMNGSRLAGPVSGLAGWFVADFDNDPPGGDPPKPEEDDGTKPPPILHAAQLSTAPDQGYTHWGQQTFYFKSAIPLLHGESTRLEGNVEMMRTQDNARLYNCRISYTASRRKVLNASSDPLQPDQVGPVLMKSDTVAQVYQIP